MRREKVIDRIRKLEALATSPNPHEAAAAAALARALKAKYGVSVARPTPVTTARVDAESAISVGDVFWVEHYGCGRVIGELAPGFWLVYWPDALGFGEAEEGFLLNECERVRRAA